MAKKPKKADAIEDLVVIDDEPPRSKRNVWGYFRGDLANVARKAEIEFKQFIVDAREDSKKTAHAAAKVFKRAAAMFHKLDEDLQKGMTLERFSVDSERIEDYLKATLKALKNQTLRKLGQNLLARTFKMLKDIVTAALEALKLAV